MFHIYDWDSVIFDVCVVVFFLFAGWYNRRQAKRNAQEWNEKETNGSRVQRRSRRRDNGRERGIRGTAERTRIAMHSAKSLGHETFDFGKVHDYSSAAGGSYVGPAVNTNGASMIGSTDIYGHSFGASSSTSSGLNRWD